MVASGPVPLPTEAGRGGPGPGAVMPGDRTQSRWIPSPGLAPLRSTEVDPDAASSRPLHPWRAAGFIVPGPLGILWHYAANGQKMSPLGQIRVTGEAGNFDAARRFIDPIERLHRLHEQAERHMDARRAELAEIRYALHELSNEGGPRPRRHGTGIEHLTITQAAPLLRYLIDNSSDTVRSSILSLDTGAGLDTENIRLTQDLIAARRFRQLTIYPMGVMDSQEGRDWVRAWGLIGEEQRLSLTPPSEFAIFDEQAVVAVLDWGDPGAEYVIVRHPMLVRAFTELFDRAFDKALPIVADDEHEGDDRRLVRLLGLGLKDESIARYLGCSLRTVRRRVARLMEVHGVQTRFQLGVAAARADLVAPADRSDR